MVLSVRKLLDCKAQCIWNFCPKKPGLLLCQYSLFGFGIVQANLPRQAADYCNLPEENSIYFDRADRSPPLRLDFKMHKRKDYLRLMSYKFLFLKIIKT
jgi:hypothetical protein